MTADVRVICATHRDLEAEVRKGRFREDLYYRVRVVEIDLPPLRVRGVEEVETLARHFAETYAVRYGRPAPVIEADALAVMRAHDWPGNVRELEHWVESAVALSPDGRLHAAAFPTPRRRADGAEVAPAGPPAGPSRAGTVADTMPVQMAGSTHHDEVAIPIGASLDEATRRFVDAVIAECGGNRTEAARRLGIGRNTLARWATPAKR